MSTMSKKKKIRCNRPCLTNCFEKFDNSTNFSTNWFSIFKAEKRKLHLPSWSAHKVIEKFVGMEAENQEEGDL